ncbi:MAG: hypothetical protein KQA41_04510 [Candidatus Aenigmarchaeota archaeon]|nr:hypothetical protein [Candidatus Aenigmarchaeota archaeon]
MQSIIAIYRESHDVFYLSQQSLKQNLDPNNPYSSGWLTRWYGINPSEIPIGKTVHLFLHQTENNIKKQ